jgi:two-component system sensor histidine kinase UhpB
LQIQFSIMKKAFLLSVFLWLVAFPLAGFSQNLAKIDSLQNELKLAKEDTLKASILNSLSKCFLMSNPGRGLDYARQTLTLAQQHNLKQYIIYAYRNISTYYYFQSDYKQAQVYLLSTIPLIEEINNKFLLCEQYNDLSNVSGRLSDFKAAVNYSDKALTIAKELKDSSMIAKVMGSKGNLYIAFSDYPAALDCLLKALSINEARKNKSLVARNYLSIGDLYKLQHDFDNALYYYQLSLKLSETLNDRFISAASLLCIGDIYTYRQKWDIAFDYYQRSLNINQELGNNNGIASSTNGIGTVYIQQGNYPMAIDCFLKAVTLSEQTGNKNSLSVSYGYLGDVYTAKKEYKKAIDYFEKSLDIARNTKQKNNEIVGLSKMTACYEAMNDLHSVVKCLKQIDSLKDGIVNETTIRKTTEMEAKYGAEKKGKEIALLTKDKQIQQLEIKKQTFFKNGLIAGLILISVLFFFVYYNYRTRQMLKLQTLRIKIASDLHDDVGSTLSSISIFSEIARQQSSEVAPMLQQISENSHKMLESMADIVWTINPENDNFEKIILRMRSFAFELLGARKIDFEFNADENIAKLNLPMNVRKNLYLIFKEATNNLVKYSYADRASFSISSSKNNLTLLIRDNGKGFNTEKSTEGNGLKNMKNRAAEIGAKFLIESEPGTGTTVQLLIKVA